MEDGCRNGLKPLVSMATILLSWYSTKSFLLLWVMIRNFGISSRIAYTDLHTENEHILPCGSIDRHIATCLTTIFWSVAVPMHDDVTHTRDVISRIASHATYL